MSNARNQNPDTYRVFPCCGCHVKRVIPIFAGIRVMIATVICLWLMFRDEMSTKEQLLVLWHSVIAGVFVYGVYERKKLAIYAYGYLEIIAIIFHIVSTLMNKTNLPFSSEKTAWVIVVCLCLALTLVLGVIYFTRVVYLYTQYLSNMQFFDNPPVIFVDKDELVPMNNTIKSRVNNRPEQSRVNF